MNDSIRYYFAHTVQCIYINGAQPFTENAIMVLYIRLMYLQSRL